MKNLKTIILFMISILLFHGCEPIEDRMELGNPVQEDQLDISATVVEINGIKTNKVILNNKSALLTKWNYGTGTSLRKSDTVLMVKTGENNIRFIGLNPDGTEVNKSLSVSVDSLYFEVPLEWGMLTDGEAKTWVWDTSKRAVWGNGGYMGSNGPEWWTLQEADINGQAPGEGVGAKMIFELEDAKLTKEYSDGKKVTGKFTFNMEKTTTLENGAVWAKGKLTTNGVTVLCGISPNENGAPVYEYDILVINNKELVLSYPEPGVQPWGTAWFWNFKAQ